MAHEKQKTRGVMTRKRAAERMALIRRENVARHNAYAARQDLRMRQVQAQRVQTMQMELDRLHESAIHGSGLDQIRLNRMNALKSVIDKYR